MGVGAISGLVISSPEGEGIAALIALEAAVDVPLGVHREVAISTR